MTPVEKSGGMHEMAKEPFLTKQMLDLLIEHVNGPVPLYRGIVIGSMTERSDRAHRMTSLREAHRKNLLTFDDKCSVLTELGRNRLCATLAEIAETLVRAGWNFELGDLLFPDEPRKVAKPKELREPVELALAERPLNSRQR